MSAALAGTPVVAPACHDTGSAVASVFAGGTSAFLSSGTWSLLGTELRRAGDHGEGARPELHQRRRRLRHDPRAQEHRRAVAAAGLPALVGRGRARSPGTKPCSPAPLTNRHAFRSLFDPDHPGFFQPPDMVDAIADYCRQTGQPVPASPAAFARAILESLAFKYRVVLDSLEELTGTAFDEIRIVGGGSRNRLLNQFTADATGRTVVAGPVEATALGNIAMQMLATGAVASLRRSAHDHRAIVSGRPVRAGRRGSLGYSLRTISRIRGDDLCLRRDDGNEVSEEPLGREGSGASSSRTRSNCCATDPTCSAPISASPISAAATPVRSST